ncbi:MAG: hypothetical protein V3V13_02580 [Paracoccaceae bacterium]
MNYLDSNNTNEAFIDLTTRDISLIDGKLVDADSHLTTEIARLISASNGYAICHNMKGILAKNGMDIHNESDAEIGRLFYEDIFRKANALFDVTDYSVVKSARYSHIAKMDADGFNPNVNFSPNTDHTESREFVTTKCIHFDAATPFIANLYGPNENISDGYPIVCDTKRFCENKGIDPRSLIENIPNNYNVAVRAEYYEEILNDYSFGIKLDFTDDLVMVALFNEVVGGVAHAATPPGKTDASKTAKRPIRHIEYQFADAGSLKLWYDFYGLDLDKATDQDDEIVKMVLDYHGSNQKPYDNFVDLTQ